MLKPRSSQRSLASYIITASSLQCPREQLHPKETVLLSSHEATSRSPRHVPCLGESLLDLASEYGKREGKESLLREPSPNRHDASPKSSPQRQSRSNSNHTLLYSPKRTANTDNSSPSKRLRHCDGTRDKASPGGKSRSATSQPTSITKQRHSHNVLHTTKSKYKPRSAADVARRRSRSQHQWP